MNKVKKYIMLTIGVCMMAVAYKSIYDPADMVTGGFSGISVIVRYFTGIPIWITNLLLNIPAFVFAYIIIGRNFVGKTLYGTILLTILLAVLPAVKLEKTDYLLAAVFGGALCGGGVGLVFRAEASTGGTDMVAAIIHHYIKRYSVIRILQVLDGAVILLGVVVFGLHVSLYAIIAIYVTTMVSDAVLEGPRHGREVMIISDKYAQITQAIIDSLGRGVTLLDGSGGYSAKGKKVIICVISKKEVPVLKEIVVKIDNRCFMAIGDVREVIGEGFVQNIQ